MDSSLTQSDAVESLLSLSDQTVAIPSNPKQHRRLASTGKTRRRLSDAREAATRPSPATLQASAAALSLASLSLSSSPPHPHLSSSLNGLSHSLAHSPVINTDSATTTSSDDSPPSTYPLSPTATPIPIANGKYGKKRGMDHKCESCSKIYRHPSCLIKHRWEHTPHWREASKFVLSKHQQVQLLEAAAILSHMSPSAPGTSLPEDRSLWPSFLSGGSLPPPDPATITNNTTPEAHHISTSPYISHPTSSSVPASSALSYTRSSSTGPRLHHYPIPSSAGSIAITQLRPGLLGVPTGPTAHVAADTIGSIPVPVPNNNDAFSAYRSSSSYTTHPPSSYQSAHSYERATDGAAGGWSLPRSSLRSVSVSSQSRSRSRSASDDESVDGDRDDIGTYGFSARSRPWKREEDESSVDFSVREEDEEDARLKQPQWDGMEMEMDMD